jgi:NADH-quinone oxidoreductase subunit N
MESLKTINPELLRLTDVQLQALLPYFLAIGGGVIATLACVTRLWKPKWPVFILSLLAVMAAMWASYSSLAMEPTLLFSQMMVVDPFSSFFGFVVLGCALLTILMSFRYLDKEGLQLPEYYVLVLFSAVGMMSAACIY